MRILFSSNNKIDAKVFTNDAEADLFLKFSAYLNWASKKDPSDIRLAMRICNQGVSEKGIYGLECIEAIDKIMMDCPPTMEAMYIFRGGEIGEVSRPYVSASLLHKYAKEYGEPKKILVPKGSVLFPTFSISPAHETSEAEIVIDNRCVIYKNGIYIYTRHAYFR